MKSDVSERIFDLVNCFQCYRLDQQAEKLEALIREIVREEMAMWGLIPV